MSLSDQEQAVLRELQRIVSAPGVDYQYDQLDGTFNGRLLNADLARELSRDYRNKYDRLCFTRCSYAPCAQYVLNRFRNVIRQPCSPGTRAVLFLAGGAASGKTSSVGQKTIKLYDLIFDSNLADFQKARMMIDESLKAGWLVDISYIHRPYDLAVRSMIERAIDTGRYVPMGKPSKMGKLHVSAQRTIVRLRREFSDDYVGIDAFENLWTPANPVDAAYISLSELDKNGQYHYKDVEELHAIEAEIIASFRESQFNEDAAFQALNEVEE